MQVTITKFRQDLFNLADQALNGELVQFVYKGRIFQVVPDQRAANKLDRLVGQPTLAPVADPAAAEQLIGEMEAEWLKDWSSL